MKILKPAVTSVLFLSAIIAGIVVSSSCNKGTPARPELRTDLPIIDSISPKSGTFETVVTIYGRNLGDNLSIITINGKKAANVTPSTTKFVIKVTDGSGTGPVVVQNAHGISSGPGPVFTYIQTLSYKVTTFAGDSAQGFTNGTGTAARFFSPAGIAFDPAGNLIVADVFNHSIRKITVPGAVVTTVAGTGTKGSVTNANPLLAQFNQPTGIAVDQQGNIYVADENNHCIRKISSAGVSTYAGIPNSAGSDSGPAATARFSYPEGIFVDKSNTVYVTEIVPSIIRKITPSLMVSTLSGSGPLGSTSGTADVAQFNSPHALTLDPSGTYLYVSDYGGSQIRKVSVATGAVSTPLGFLNNTGVFLDGVGNNAGFYGPCGITIDASGNLYIAEVGNNRIREVLMPQLQVITLAGNSGKGFSDGDGDQATFQNPYGIVRDANGIMYVTDGANNRIRKITPYKH
ncbi:MAG: IPT/TIG domain-containing protein [Bacteroidota bacterium]